MGAFCTTAQLHSAVRRAGDCLSFRGAKIVFFSETTITFIFFAIGRRKKSEIWTCGQVARNKRRKAKGLKNFEKITLLLHTFKKKSNFAGTIKLIILNAEFIMHNS